ncbi:hypothetical protein DFH09DRAFT_1338490 [Mycena vulgaris]|nr:hypothetical protein DFH09DRAFT_1338490 [Mycena vulgaris]
MKEAPDINIAQMKEASESDTTIAQIIIHLATTFPLSDPALAPLTHALAAAPVLHYPKHATADARIRGSEPLYLRRKSACPFSSSLRILSPDNLLTPARSRVCSAVN